MFDIRQTTTPFAMRPGLQRLEEGAVHFARLDPASTLAAEKSRVWRHANACLIDPDFALAGMALQAVAQQMVRDWGDLGSLSAIKNIATNPLNTLANTEKIIKNTAQTLSMSAQEDFAVLDARPGQNGRLPLLCVTCPSHWAPEDKLGLSLAQVHAPVADNAMLLSANAALVQLVTRGERWQRHVWTITPCPRFDAHPARQPPRKWPATTDPTEFASQCWLRSERQTFFPVRQGQTLSGLAIFTIGLTLQALPQALPSAEHVSHLHASLSSMSAAVLAYKGLTEAQAPLLAWLGSERAQ